MIAVILIALLIASFGLVGIVLPQTDPTPLVRGHEGGLVETDTRNNPKTGHAEGAIRMGIVVVPGTAGDQLRPLAAADAVALDADGIYLALACAATEQRFEGVGANGAGGAGPWPVSRYLTMTRSAHADADAVVTLLTYVAEGGRVITNEPHLATNGGGDVLQSDHPAIAFGCWVVPAQQAGGGSTTSVGWGALGGVNGIGISMRDETIDPAVDGVITDGLSMSYLDEGTIYVLPEDAVVKGFPVYVRVAAAGAGETFGRMGPDVDGGDCLPLWGATWGESGDENAVVPVILNK